MRKIAVFTRAGGQGKSTIVVNLGAALATIYGRRVLQIDCDMQCDSSDAHGVPFNQQDYDHIYHVFAGKKGILECLTQTSTAGVEAIPGTPFLHELEFELAAKLERERILKKQLELLPLNRWDYILIDLPPAFNLVSINALTAAEELLIPVQANNKGVKACTAVLDAVDQIRAGPNPGLTILGVVPFLTNKRRRMSQATVQWLEENFPKFVTPEIRENTKTAESFGSEQSVLEYDPRGHGPADFARLAEFIEQHGRKLNDDKAHRSNGKDSKQGEEDPGRAAETAVARPEPGKSRSAAGG